MHTPSSQPPAHKKLPHTEVLWGIKNRISEILDSETFLLQGQELEKLFMQLNDTLDAKVNKAWYDYKDYEQRLLRWEEELEAILLQDQDLRVHYENILRAIEFAPYLKQALWDKLLFDRLLELWPSAQEFLEPVTFSFAELKTNPGIPSSLDIKNIPSDATVQELEELFSKIENTPWVLSIGLTDNNLWTFRKDQPQAFFPHPWNARSINGLWDFDESRLQAIFPHLWNARSINGLWDFDESRLQAIFFHLWDVRSIDVRGTDLWKLNEPSLQAIFSYLGNVRSLKMWNNRLWKLDESRLHAIFSHLGNVRSIDLNWNVLWTFDKPRLQAIFSHLGSVRSIDLGMNNLWQLDEPSLQAIFSYLGNVRSLKLGGNGLWQLDEPSLQAIFSHLIHIGEVILDSREEVARLESLFPHLIGKFKIV